MEKSYYVDSNIKIKNYGIYEYFSREKNNQRKTFGAINDSKYLFNVDIYDHYGAWEEIKQDIENFSLWFSPYGKKDQGNKLEFGVNNTDENNNVTAFQLECILGMLDECRRYCKDKGEEFQVYIPAYCFKEKEGICTKDLDSLINQITEHLNELKESKKSINNLKIFKLLKKDMIRKIK